MTVNLSALAGAGQQFFDNNGTILTAGKLYSYAAGTTTPQATYTTASGSTAHSNPIVLDSAGRVATGEIWLTAGNNYKFVLKTSADVTLATWDNITGINGTGITSNASSVAYDPAGTGAVATTVQSKLRESVSVKDFGAATAANINAALLAAGTLPVRLSSNATIETTILIGSNQTIIIDDWVTLTASASTLGSLPMLTNSNIAGGNTNVVVSGGRWLRTENAGVTVVPCINFTKVTDGRIEKVRSTNTGTPVYNVPTQPGIIDLRTCSNITVTDCEINSCLSSHGFNANGSSYVSFINCLAQNSGDSTFSVDTSPYCNILNCRAINSSGSHIAFNSQYGIVRGNTIIPGALSAAQPAPGINLGENTAPFSASYSVCSENVISAWASGAAIQTQQPYTDYCTISNNNISGMGGATSFGIYLDGTNHTVTGNSVVACHLGIQAYGDSQLINANTVSLCTSTGIYVTPSTNTVVSNNRVLNNTGTGIKLFTSASNTLVIGNLCTDTRAGGSKTQTIGISGSTSSNTYAYNSVAGNSTTGFDPGVATAFIGPQNIDLATTAIIAIFTLDNTGTPSVLNQHFAITNAGAANITNFTGGVTGQIITIVAAGSITIKNGASIKLAGATDYVMTTSDIATLVCSDLGIWYEVSRSVN